MARMHRAGKPVIALRAGRSARGAAATAAHTGSLAGSNEAFNAFFDRVGIIQTDDMDGFVETANLCLTLKERPRSPGVAILGVSGGGVAHVSDIADEVGLSLPALAPDTLERLASLLPPFATPQNPLDTTGVVFADGGIYRDVLETLAADPAIGVIVASQDAPAGLDQPCAEEYLGIATAVADFSAASDVPVIFMSNLSSGHHTSVEAALGKTPVGRGTRATLTAIGNLSRHRTEVTWPGERSASRITLPAHPLSEGEAKSLLQAQGMAVPLERLVQTRDEAAEAAAEIGFPVVM
jgi:acyl-CoA synthetase (NDP forming)